MDRNASRRPHGDEFGRGARLGPAFAHRGPASQAFARDLQPSETIGRHAPLNRAEFRHGNGFESHMFGGREWRGREGRFRRFWARGIFWPFLFGDYVSYAIWPTVYAEPFWTYGPSAILWGSLWPSGGYQEGDLSGGNRYPEQGETYQGDVYSGEGGGSARRGRARAAGSEQMAAMCSGFAPDVADLPLEQLERLIQPAPEQRAVLDELKAAAAKASQILRAACPGETPATPVARLDAMEQRLAAMQQAVAITRGPLERLYELLSDAQIERLENAAAEPGAKDQPSMNIAELCSIDSGLTNVPADEIARAINLTDEQRFNLDKLRQVSEKAGEDLRASCPTGAARSLNARLDVAQKRIAALIRAIETIRPAMAFFYASLSDEQKGALNAQRGPSQSARR